MITEEQVWTVLLESNPVPDIDVFDGAHVDSAAYLATLEQRSSKVTQLDDRSPTDTKRRSGMIWLGAAAAAVLIGTVVVLTTTGGEDTPPATNPTSTTQALTTTQVEEPAEVTAVLAAVAAFNSGDAEAFEATFDPSSEIVIDTWDFQGGTYHIHDVMMAANEQLTVVGDCVVSADDDAVVECLIAERNHWHGKAGITHEVETRFRVNNAGLVTSWTFDYGCCEDESDFNAAFSDWMFAVHRDVWSEIGAVDRVSFPGYLRDPAHMAAALEYVDEFIAQSEVYPVDNHQRVVGEAGD